MVIPRAHNREENIWLTCLMSCWDDRPNKSCIVTKDMSVEIDEMGSLLIPAVLNYTLNFSRESFCWFDGF